jgi:hypothetical protein
MSWNTSISTAALQTIEFDELWKRCLGVKLDKPVNGEHKYRDLALEIGGWCKDNDRVL